jgi:hypothetical protein
MRSLTAAEVKVEGSYPPSEQALRLGALFIGDPDTIKDFQIDNRNLRHALSFKRFDAATATSSLRVGWLSGSSRACAAVTQRNSRASSFSLTAGSPAHRQV